MSAASRLLAMSAGGQLIAFAVATVLGQDHSDMEATLANGLRLATSNEAKLALIKRISDTQARSVGIARALGSVVASDDIGVTSAAADALAMQGAYAWPVLADALRHRSASVKIQVLRAVAQTEALPATILASVAEILRDSKQPLAVRVQASVTLGQRGIETLALVRPLLNSDDPIARELALDSIRLTGVRTMTLAHAVEHAANDKEPRVRAAAAACFAAWGFFDDAMAVALPLLGEADQYVRYSALGVLDVMGEHVASAVRPLANYLATTMVDGERLQIVKVLGRTGDKAAVEPILGVLRVDPGDGDALITLPAAVRAALRAAALKALRRLGPIAEEAVPVLTGMLSDEEQRLWWPEAIEVLEAIGPAAKAAVRTLERLASQEPQWLGARCARALARIKGR